MKHKFLITSFILCFHFCYSQDESKIAPIHIIKIDVFKSFFSQLHFDYERYNGKKGAVEIGVGLFYRNPALLGINQSLTYDISSNLYSFQYKGVGVELKRKFYFPKAHWNPYVAPELSLKYKYFDNETVLVADKKNSSDAKWNTVSRQMYKFGISGVFGFTTKLKRGFFWDLNAGLGFGYIDVNTVVSDYGRYNYHAEIEGHGSYTVLSLQASAKFCFGFNGKSK